MLHDIGEALTYAAYGATALFFAWLAVVLTTWVAVSTVRRLDK